MKRFPDPSLFPLEHEVVRLVDRYLSTNGWNLARIPCFVEFGVRIRTPSDHELRLQGADGQGVPVGQLRLWYNFAYLHQRPGEFLYDIVAHQCAHVLTEYEAARDGREVALHGEEWASWLARLSFQARPEASGPGAIFDDRAIRLQKGGLPGRCRCEGIAGFRVLASVRRSGSDDSCPDCRTAPRPVTPEDVPTSIAEEIRFIQRTLVRTDMGGWLG